MAPGAALLSSSRHSRREPGCLLRPAGARSRQQLGHSRGWPTPIGAMLGSNMGHWLAWAGPCGAVWGPETSKLINGTEIPAWAPCPPANTPPCVERNLWRCGTAILGCWSRGAGQGSCDTHCRGECVATPCPSLSDLHCPQSALTAWKTQPACTQPDPGAAQGHGRQQVLWGQNSRCRMSPETRVPLCCCGSVRVIQPLITADQIYTAAPMDWTAGEAQPGEPAGHQLPAGLTVMSPASSKHSTCWPTEKPSVVTGGKPPPRSRVTSFLVACLPHTGRDQPLRWEWLKKTKPYSPQKQTGICFLPVLPFFDR